MRNHPAYDFENSFSLLSKFDCKGYKSGFIAEGEFAFVLSGVNTQTQEKVAFKIEKTREKRLDAKYGLKAEHELIKSFKHPNIIQTLGYTEINRDNQLYQCLILEFCNAGTLGKFISNNVEKSMNPSEDSVKPYFVQIFQALQYLHSRQVMHRDLKPDNILLNNVDGIVTLKLADFGFSREWVVLNANKTMIIGTPFYMAPEVRLGNPKKDTYSYSAEYWSFGCIMYEVLSGEHLQINESRRDYNDFLYINKNILFTFSMTMQSAVKICLELDQNTRAQRIPMLERYLLPQSIGPLNYVKMDNIIPVNKNNNIIIYSSNNNDNISNNSSVNMSGFGLSKIGDKSTVGLKSNWDSREYVEQRKNLILFVKNLCFDVDNPLYEVDQTFEMLASLKKIILVEIHMNKISINLMEGDTNTLREWLTEINVKLSEMNDEFSKTADKGDVTLFYLDNILRKYKTQFQANAQNFETENRFSLAKAAYESALQCLGFISMFLDSTKFPDLAESIDFFSNKLNELSKLSFSHSSSSSLQNDSLS